jgi:hypothetical protein
MGFFDNPIEEIGDTVDDVVEDVTGGDDEESQSSQPPASFPDGTDTDGDGSPDASFPDSDPEPEPDPDPPASFPSDDTETDTGGGGGFTGGTDTDGFGNQKEDDSSSNSSNDDSTSVVVTGGPGTGKEQKTVGVGDDLEEAQADAAANPNFDAAEGSEIDSIEESIGADGAADKDSSSVVVTGGPGTGKPQKTVGQGNTTLQARRDAARNQRFNAAQGGAVDALETGLNIGQGDGTSSNELINNLRGNGRSNSRNQNKINNLTNNNIDRQDVRDLDPVESQPFRSGRIFESLEERRRETEKAFEEKPEALANLFEVGSDLQGFETAEDVAFRQADSLEEQQNISEIDRLSVDEQVQNRIDQLVAAGIITEEEEDLVEATATSASVEKKADVLSENFVFQELGDLIASGESFFVDSTQSQNQFLEENNLDVDVGKPDRPELNESFTVENASIEGLPEPPANATSTDNVEGLQDINVTERGDTRAENLAGLVLDPAQFVTSGRQFEAGLERAVEGQTEGDLTEEAAAAGTVGAGVLANQISEDPLGFAIEEGIGPGAAITKGSGVSTDSFTPSLARQDPAFQAPESVGSKGRTGDGKEFEGTSSFQPEGTQDVAGRLVGSERQLQRQEGLRSSVDPEEAVRLENNFEDQGTSLTDIVLGGDRLPEDPTARGEILNPGNIEAVNPVSFTLEGGTETVQGRLDRLEALRQEFGPGENRQADMFRELRRQEAREEPGLTERTKEVLTNTRKGQAELVLEEKPGDVDKGDTVDTEKLVGRDDRRQDVDDRAVDFTERDGLDSRGRSRDSAVESVNDRIDAGVETIGFSGIDTDTDLGVDQGQGQGLDQDQGVEPEQPFDIDNQQEPGNAGIGGVDNVFRNFEERVNETFQRGRSEERRGRRKGGFPGLEIDLELGGGRSFDDFGGSESPQAAPSVDAILFGDTTEEEVEDEKVFTGFETREVSEEFNLF